MFGLAWAAETCRQDRWEAPVVGSVVMMRRPSRFGLFRGGGRPRLDLPRTGQVQVGQSQQAEDVHVAGFHGTAGLRGDSKILHQRSLGHRDAVLKP